MADALTMESDPKSPGHRKFLELQAERVSALRSELMRFSPDPAGIVLEIGCGHGHYLTAYAEHHPMKYCIGIDLVSRRIRKANAKRDKRNLERLAFIKADVRELMMAWPEHLATERIFILFPDPWPKKRHTKNRILQTTLLDQLAGLSQVGTCLHFRTDDEANFAWGMDVIGSHKAWQIDDSISWPFENTSFFQDLFTGHYSLTARFIGNSVPGTDYR